MRATTLFNTGVNELIIGTLFANVVTMAMTIAVPTEMDGLGLVAQRMAWRRMVET